MESIARIAEAAEAEDGVAPLDEATWRTLHHHGDAVRTWEREHGFALLIGDELSLVVEPGHRGQGLGRELAAESVPDDGALAAWSHADHPAAAALASRHGLRRDRALWVMRRRTGEPLPELVVPSAVTVRGYRDDDRDELLRVNAAAFAHHPEQGAMDAEELAGRMAEPWFDPAGLLVADDGAGLRGFHWTKQHSPALGEVYVVGIDPAAQGQGLGRVLTLAGLHHLEAAGVAEVLLYVESDNLPAVHVYSGLGFTHAAKDTHVQYRRP